MFNECVACHEEKESVIIEHHVSYYPERKVPVHRSCHTSIHAGTKYQHLMPDVRQIIRFYKQNIALVQWLHGDFERIVPKFFKKIEKIERFWKRRFDG